MRNSSFMYDQLALATGNITRKILVIATAIVTTLAIDGVAALAEETSKQPTREETIKAVSDNFSAIPTMTGEFVQFGPNGEQSGGVFYIERPGKIRFNYESPASIEVISNGKTVAIHNKKLKTWDFYPLSKTPLKLLLDDELEVDSEAIRDIVSEPDLTTIVMGDDRIFGDSEITLMFDPLSFDLRQWTIKYMVLARSS